MNPMFSTDRGGQQFFSLSIKTPNATYIMILRENHVQLSIVVKNGERKVVDALPKNKYAKKLQKAFTLVQPDVKNYMITEEPESYWHIDELLETMR